MSVFSVFTTLSLSISDTLVRKKVICSLILQLFKIIFLSNVVLAYTVDQMYAIR